MNNEVKISKMEKIKNWTKEHKREIAVGVVGTAVIVGSCIIYGKVPKDTIDRGNKAKDILNAILTPFDPEKDLLDPSLMTEGGRYCIMDVDTGDLFKYIK